MKFELVNSAGTTDLRFHVQDAVERFILDALDTQFMKELKEGRAVMIVPQKVTIIAEHNKFLVVNIQLAMNIMVIEEVHEYNTENSSTPVMA